MGVVAGVKHFEIEEDLLSTLYLPVAQAKPWQVPFALNLVAKTADLRHLEDLRRLVGRVDPLVAASQPKTLDNLMSTFLSPSPPAATYASRRLRDSRARPGRVRALCGDLVLGRVPDARAWNPSGAGSEPRPCHAIGSPGEARHRAPRNCPGRNRPSRVGRAPRDVHLGSRRSASPNPDDRLNGPGSGRSPGHVAPRAPSGSGRTRGGAAGGVGRARLRRP